jgi:hypothetical protein
MNEEEERVEALNDIWFFPDEDPFDFTPLSKIIERLKREAVEMLNEEMEMIKEEIGEADGVLSAKPPDMVRVMEVSHRMEELFAYFLASLDFHGTELA